MRPKVLVIYGSPRKGGNTDTLMEAAIEGVLEEAPRAQIDRIRANDLGASPCRSCGDCDLNGICSTTDAMDEVYGKLENADILLVSSPVFFMGISAQLKLMVDRCQCIWVRNFILDKDRAARRSPRIAAFLSAAGQRGDKNFTGPDNTMVAWFASLGYHYDERLFIEDMDGKGGALGATDVLEQARELGKRTVGHLRRRRQNLQ